MNGRQKVNNKESVTPESRKENHGKKQSQQETVPQETPKLTLKQTLTKAYINPNPTLKKTKPSLKQTLTKLNINPKPTQKKP